MARQIREEKRCQKDGTAEGNAIPLLVMLPKAAERDVRKTREDALRETAKKVFYADGKKSYGAEGICGSIRREGLKSSHTKRRQRTLTDSRKTRGPSYEQVTKDLEIDTPQVLCIQIQC